MFQPWMLTQQVTLGDICIYIHIYICIYTYYTRYIWYYLYIILHDIFKPKPSIMIQYEVSLSTNQKWRSDEKEAVMLQTDLFVHPFRDSSDRCCKLGGVHCCWFGRCQTLGMAWNHKPNLGPSKVLRYPNCWLINPSNYRYVRDMSWYDKLLPSWYNPSMVDKSI